MRAYSDHYTPSAALTVGVCLVGVGLVAACGLSASGLANPDASSADASLVDAVAPSVVDASTAEGTVDAEGDVVANGDAAPDDASLPGVDAADAAPSCTPYDAGLNGALALSTFVVAGNASYDENSDGRITLTNSSNDQAGAAWYPTTMSGVSGYDLTWSLRVGPGDTDGEGITFAVLSSIGTPGVGDDGDGLGLRNITESGGDGGIPSGYAVELVTYDNTTDPTNLGAVTLKLATMPGFTPVAETAVPALNDGNTYSVEVSWRAPSSLRATLYGPDGGVFNVTSSNPGLDRKSVV